MDLYILRGVPGCGKSTVAQTLTLSETVGKICEADRFFMKDGVYKFDFTKLSAAHEWCRSECIGAMRSKIPLIVVSNTNILPKEFAAYEKMAKEFGYNVFHIIIENYHGNMDSHGVPEESLVRMETNLRANIQLR